MRAVICPVCQGAGKITKNDWGYSTSAIQEKFTCHGCDGKGWVTVPEDTIYQTRKEDDDIDKCQHQIANEAIFGRK